MEEPGYQKPCRTILHHTKPGTGYPLELVQRVYKKYIQNQEEVKERKIGPWCEEFCVSTFILGGIYEI
jgi:hypothetical protein